MPLRGRQLPRLKEPGASPRPPLEIYIVSRLFRTGPFFCQACPSERLLAGSPDPLEIPPVRTTNGDGVVEAIAEAVREDGVVHRSAAAVPLRDREVLVGRHPVTQLRGDRLEVGRSAELFGAEAAGHLACELRDVTLLRCPDQDSLHTELLQLGCHGPAAPGIKLELRHDLPARRLSAARWARPRLTQEWLPRRQPPTDCRHRTEALAIAFPARQRLEIAHAPIAPGDPIPAEDPRVFRARMTAPITQRRVLALRTELERPPRAREPVAAVTAEGEHTREIGFPPLRLEPQTGTPGPSHWPSCPVA